LQELFKGLKDPVTITFGYDATPVKPLPEDWRSAYVHYHQLEDVESDLAMWRLWSDSRYDRFRPSVFLLRPDDMEGFAALRKPGQQVHAVKLAPFVNQHVTVPAWPENQAEDKCRPVSREQASGLEERVVARRGEQKTI